MTDTTGLDRALGAIGTTFRLTRLYPPTHPAVQEALRQVGEAIPPLAAVGTVEWKVGATGLHWHGQQLLPRNSQIAELAGLLYARGVRTLTLNPGMTADHVLALFQVATGTAAPDAQTLGRITITLGRRSAARLERTRPPTPAEGVPAIVDPASGGVPAAAAPAPKPVPLPPRIRSCRRSVPAPRFGPTPCRPTWRRPAPWRRCARRPRRMSSAPRLKSWRRWRPNCWGCARWRPARTRSRRAAHPARSP